MLSKMIYQNIKKIVGTEQSPNINNKQYDVIYCVDSFHHFTNGYKKEDWQTAVDKAINELLKLLKENGKLIILEFDTDQIGGKLIRFFENTIYRWGSLFYNQTEIKQLFEKYDTKTIISKLDSYSYIITIQKIIKDSL